MCVVLKGAQDAEQFHNAVVTEQHVRPGWCELVVGRVDEGSGIDLAVFHQVVGKDLEKSSCRALRGLRHAGY